MMIFELEDHRFNLGETGEADFLYELLYIIILYCKLSRKGLNNALNY